VLIDARGVSRRRPCLVLGARLGPFPVHPGAARSLSIVISRHATFSYPYGGSAPTGTGSLI
jgi:hypothetical protein